MLDRLQKQIAVEKEQLSHLIETHKSLLEKCQTQIPETIEISALAAFLHSYYTGIENVFKRVLVEFQESSPKGEIWHRQLLDQMAQAASTRPAVISEALKQKLRGYLDFRHMFRHAYSFELKWAKMASLVHECEDVLLQLFSEIDAFFHSV